MADSNDLTDDARWMREAIALAQRARPSPNPRVGCVLVREGSVVGRGFHLAAGGPHAEAAALADAGPLARGATAYVTLEPCNHHGRTPPCTDALLEAGVRRVVVGIPDPNPRVRGRGSERLASEGIELTLGVEKEACTELLRAWIHFVTTGLPWVTLKAACTLDGRIATHTGDSRWITGPEARRDVHALRARCDAVLVGVRTVLADDPLLTVRDAVLHAPPPLRVVLDSQLRTPETSALVKSANEAPVLLFHAGNASQERVERLSALGVSLVAVPREEHGLSLHSVLRELAQRDIVELLVEGGAEVHGALLDAKLACGAVWYLAPSFFGGATAPGAIAGKGVAKAVEAHRLHNVSVDRVGEDLRVSGEFRHVHGDHH